MLDYSYLYRPPWDAVNEGEIWTRGFLTVERTNNFVTPHPFPEACQISGFFLVSSCSVIKKNDARDIAILPNKQTRKIPIPKGRLWGGGLEAAEVTHNKKRGCRPVSNLSASPRNRRLSLSLTLSLTISFSHSLFLSLSLSLTLSFPHSLFLSLNVSLCLNRCCRINYFKEVHTLMMSPLLNLLNSLSNADIEVWRALSSWKWLFLLFTPYSVLLSSFSLPVTAT